MGPFQFLAIINKAAVNILVHKMFFDGHTFSVLVQKFLGLEVLGHRVGIWVLKFFFLFISMIRKNWTMFSGLINQVIQLKIQKTNIPCSISHNEHLSVSRH